MKRTSKSTSNTLERPSPEPDFTQLVELRDFLRVKLPTLPDNQRDTVSQMLDGKSYSEIAAAAGVDECVVRQRFGRAVKSLRQIAESSR